MEEPESSLSLSLSLSPFSLSLFFLSFSSVVVDAHVNTPEGVEYCAFFLGHFSFYWGVSEITFNHPSQVRTKSDFFYMHYMWNFGSGQDISKFSTTQQALLLLWQRQVEKEDANLAIAPPIL